MATYRERVNINSIKPLIYKFTKLNKLSLLKMVDFDIDFIDLNKVKTDIYYSKMENNIFKRTCAIQLL